MTERERAMRREVVWSLGLFGASTGVTACDFRYTHFSVAAASIGAVLVVRLVLRRRPSPPQAPNAAA